MEEVVVGNLFDKYHTKNPLYRKLMKNFLENFVGYIDKEKKITILEVGCGEGLLAREIFEKRKVKSYTGLDIEEEIISDARVIAPDAHFEKGNIYDLKKFTARNFDYIICSEVLEHLDEPGKGIKELKRLDAAKYMFSVPKEPVWRALNMMRLKYLKDFGNTPGHLQHWSRKGFEEMLSFHFQIVDSKSVFPWSMALCKKP